MVLLSRTVDILPPFLLSASKERMQRCLSARIAASNDFIAPLLYCSSIIDNNHDSENNRTELPSCSSSRGQQAPVFSPIFVASSSMNSRRCEYTTDDTLL
ncbi:unnamed protein product [Gongylonema pulchrum]|uniref:Secreted protein n=1 Tax=Gongylonema pulchrum TaxID=637853 RepID=A0A183CV78_9BILA|nr:unnamed protein product [Gongylonema pulchrum]